MAIFKSKGNNLSRASAILDSLSPKDTTDIPPVEPVTPPVDVPPVDTPPVEPVTPPVDVPPVDTPPVEPITPPTDGLATPPVVEIPEPVVPQSAEVTEELLLAKLSEKLGRTVSNFDELTPKGLF